MTFAVDVRASLGDQQNNKKRRLFASGDKRIGASASASVLPVNIQGWLPLGLSGLISLQSKAQNEEVRMEAVIGFG